MKKFIRGINVNIDPKEPRYKEVISYLENCDDKDFSAMQRDVRRYEIAEVEIKYNQIFYAGKKNGPFWVTYNKDFFEKK